LLWSEAPPSGLPPLPVDPLLVRVGGMAQSCFLTKWEVGTKTGPPAAPVEVFALLGTRAEVLLSEMGVDLAPRDGSDGLGLSSPSSPPAANRLWSSATGKPGTRVATPAWHIPGPSDQHPLGLAPIMRTAGSRFTGCLPGPKA
jgi:hypothetical protein